MAPLMLYPVKKLIAITPEVAQAIEDYRFANRLKSEAETIRRLIEAGLKTQRRAQSGSGSGGPGKPASTTKSAPRPRKTSASKPRSSRATSSQPLGKEAQFRELREQGTR